MTNNKTSLQNAINAVNKRYSKGLNDDDQVQNMVKIANNLKGYHFKVEFENYVIIKDIEYLQLLAIEFGYWSEQVKNFNSILTNKGGNHYMTTLNNKVK